MLSDLMARQAKATGKGISLAQVFQRTTQLNEIEFLLYGLRPVDVGRT